MKPIIISKDFYILDGHHRWLAHYNMGDKPIPVMQINLNANKVMDEVHGRPWTDYKSLDEAIKTILSEDENIKIACALLSESLDAGKDEEQSITEAADLCGVDVADLKGMCCLMEAASKKKTSAYKPKTIKVDRKEVEHPIRTIRRIATTNKPGKITFKDGSSKAMKVDDAKAIIHVHKNLSAANQKRIEAAVTNPEHHKHIVSWAKAHAKVGMEDKKKALKESCDPLTDGDHCGKKVLIERDGHEHHGKRGVVESSSPCGGLHTVTNDKEHYGVHETKHLKLLTEDEMSIDGSGSSRSPLATNTNPISYQAATGYLI